MMSSRVFDLVDTHDNRRVGSQVCYDGDMFIELRRIPDISDIVYRNSDQKDFVGETMFKRKPMQAGDLRTRVMWANLRVYVTRRAAAF